jgi:hypothetical protein
MSEETAKLLARSSINGGRWHKLRPGVKLDRCGDYQWAVDGWTRCGRRARQWDVEPWQDGRGICAQCLSRRSD